MMRLLRLRPHLFFDPLDVPAAEPFHFAAQLEILPNRIVGQDPEAVDDRQRITCPRDDLRPGQASGKARAVPRR